ncbi:MAG TPA: SBBP repeat-containing protein [Terriglobia bacterium]|nr:SBBP repeat-containing protein [Terriglobia bacterium]
MLASHNRVAFRLPHYDRSRALVIDPVLTYSSYVGGSGYESGKAVAVDNAGNAYLTGDTASADFPTANPLQASSGTSASDVFVTKLNASGSALMYSTYLGGGAGNWGTGVAVDSSGNAYVVGNTTSTDFPTAKPFQAIDRASPRARCSAFVAKLNTAGTRLLYSTYLGGSVENWGYGIAVDSSGSAYVTGSTLSPDFPTAVPLQATNKATPKTETVTAFIAKLNSSGSALVYSTYLGGSDGESAQASPSIPPATRMSRGIHPQMTFPQFTRCRRVTKATLMPL